MQRIKSSDKLDASKIFEKTKRPGFLGLTEVDEWELGLLGGHSVQCVYGVAGGRGGAGG